MNHSLQPASSECWGMGRLRVSGDSILHNEQLAKIFYDPTAVAMKDSFDALMVCTSS